MAQQPNRLLRIAVPLVLVLAGFGVAAAVFVNSSKSTSTTPAPVTAPAPNEQADAQPETGAVDEPAPEQTTAPETAQPEPAAPTEAISGLRTRPVADASQPFSSIGGIDANGPARMKVDFSRVGAGVASLRLASEFDNIQSATDDRLGKPVGEEHHVQLQREQSSGTSVVTPFAAIWVEINGSVVPLIAGDAWRETAPGSFEAVVEDTSGAEVLRLRRTYILTDGTNDLRIEQRVENVSGRALDVRLVQFGPVDLPPDAVTYGGDKRRVRFGYLLRPELDRNREYVLGKKFLTPRAEVLGPRDPAGSWVNPETGKAFKPYVPSRQVWPNTNAIGAGLEIVWAAMTNRYYGVAVHTVGAPGEALAMEGVETIDRVVLQQANQPKDGVLILRLTGEKKRLAPGENAGGEIMVYAGPLSRGVIDQSPAATAAGVKSIVVYNFGGPCAFCTFTWLSDPLLSLIRFLDSVVRDWSLAIILLVFIVRGILHPVNRWSQIRMQRFGKQMQDLAPKQKKIQEKYAGDRQRIQQEVAKLWREEGVSPAGMLGCIPMLLQSPIWIALYASLYFLYELRQQPAFFGLFQVVTGGSWGFMADLSEPDHFVPLPAGMHFTLPLMGQITALNIMPLLLGVVFFMHQKYLTPPTSVTMTPEQQQQQKIIKVMTVVMFPVIMYNAPSGLALYFIANSTIAIIENGWIRSHIKKHNLLEVPKKVQKPRGGFLARLQQVAQQQQALREQQKRVRENGSPKKPGGESAAERAMRKGRGK